MHRQTQSYSIAPVHRVENAPLNVMRVRVSDSVSCFGRAAVYNVFFTRSDGQRGRGSDLVRCVTTRLDLFRHDPHALLWQTVGRPEGKYRERRAKDSRRGGGSSANRRSLLLQCRYYAVLESSRSSGIAQRNASAGSRNTRIPYSPCPSRNILNMLAKPNCSSVVTNTARRE
jgi:hypothetical protein